MSTNTMFRALALAAGTALLGACASLQTSAGAPATEVRVVSGVPYRVIRAEPLYLYERDKTVVVGKRFQAVPERYFSTGANTPLRPLALTELKKAYPDNHKFHDVLTLAFSNDAELMKWDSFHNEFLVSRLLRQSWPAGTLSAR